MFQLTKAHQDKHCGEWEIEIETTLSHRLLVEKTPHHMYVAGLLERVNPGSRFVNVLRDAGDVALSMFLRPFSAHFPESSSLDALADTLALRMEVADAWREAGLNVKAFSFDAFRASPEPQGEKLFGHLGLNWSPDYLDQKYMLRQNRIGRIMKPLRRKRSTGFRILPRRRMHS